VTKLQFCHAIAREAPASGLEKTPANGGIGSDTEKIFDSAKRGIEIRGQKTGQTFLNFEFLISSFEKERGKTL
jgi:hypothetical protein